MKKTLWLASTTLVAAAMITAPAYAGGKSKSDMRDQEIQELKARLDRLEREAEDEKIAAGARMKSIEEHQEAQPVWSFKDTRPTITSPDGAFSLAFRGRAQLDLASFEQDPDDFGAGYGAPGTCNLTNVLCDQGSGAVFRRLRFGIEGHFFKDFVYEMRFEFGGSGAEGSGTINIMRVGYTGIPNLRIHGGAIQPIMTLYDPTSSSALTTIERAAVITTLVGNFGGDSARRGIEATFQKENMFWEGSNIVLSAAYTGDRIGADHTGIPDNDETTHLLGRAAIRLIGTKDMNVQVGVTASEVLDPPSVMRLRERPEIRVGGDRFIDTGNIVVDGASAYGFEFGANFHNFYLAAEWYEMTLDRPGAGTDPTFDGYYIEGEWILTGESKRYVAGGTNNNVGVWKDPSIKNPLGVWSLHGRYSVLDLNYNEGLLGFATPVGGIRGGEQTVTNVGVTWYINSNLKWMGEYAMVDIDRMSGAGADLDAEFDILQSRVMFTF